jgi:hypothetical protein
MRFLVKLVLAFVAGVALGYGLLSLWDLAGGPDLFNARFGQW